MNTHLDSKISSLHKKGSSISKIADQIENKFYKQDLLDIDSILSYCGFLYSSGMYHRLFNFVIYCIEHSKPVPWFYFFLLASQINLQNIDKEWIANFFLKHSKDSDWDYLLNSSFLANPTLTKKKQHFLNSFYQNHPIPQLELESKIASTEDKVQLKKYIEKLIELDPKNPTFQYYMTQYQTKKAVEFLSMHKIKKGRNKVLEAQSFSDFPPSFIKKHWLQVIQKTVKKSQISIEDIVIALDSMGWHSLAAEFLEKHLDQFTRQILYLEQLVRSKQYLKCLNYADQLYATIPPDTDMTFEISLLKARSYCGLREYQKAHSIVNNLISIKPKSQTLLSMLSHLTRVSGIK